MDVKNLNIDAADISGELATQASKFMYVAELYVQALGEYDKAALDTERLYSQLDGDIRRTAKAEAEKVTEKAIEMQIKTDSMYNSRSNTLIHSRVKRDLLRNLKDAWAMRGENIMKIAMVQRDEKYAMKTTSLSDIAAKVRA